MQCRRISGAIRSRVMQAECNWSAATMQLAFCVLVQSGAVLRPLQGEPGQGPGATDGSELW